MSSNNYGVAMTVESIGTWLRENWDQNCPAIMLSTEEGRTDIPDLREMQLHGKTMDGGAALVFIREHSEIDAINWGNGHIGVCVYDGDKPTYIMSWTKL